MTLHRSLVLLAAAGLVAGCGEPKPDPSLQQQPVIPASAAEAVLDTGGSGAGDFGPPQGVPIQAVLTDAPNVPPPIHRSYPAKVIVNLTVKELKGELADGVEYTFWTFGGHVPGKFIRVRQGDTVEFHLKNAPGNKMPHNIDMHAVTGPGGGAASTFTAPGHESVFTFKALVHGLFVYHCAVAPVGMHIANGMYGMILVEPPNGLPPVDREYYVMQGDFYTSGPTDQKGFQAFDMQKAIDERPTYVLFNGRENSLTGANALRAHTGQRIRLFVGNGGPNLVSSFHVIGEMFDHVYPEGGSHPQENVQTTLIPSGGATIVDFKAEVPGTYTMVDHSIFRAFNKGALGQIQVDGPPRKDLYSGKEADKVFVGDAAPETTAPAPAVLAAASPAPAPAEATPTPATAAAPGKALTFEEQMEAGHKTFTSICQACHQPDAKGLPGMFPPLAGSDFLMADKDRAIHIVTTGLSGPVTVNGKTFNSQMPPLSYLSDQDVANVLTFVRNSFGNKGGPVTLQEVQKVRGTGSARGQM